ncbi:mitochondrial carrier domain-containing protein [Hypoxylon rubiginosum]|uniref:Mitochondrial carrier domain-containing protein n=1 Tax=Hypoxylon rubiginosum TaxID=110542 RepID=A0ACC0CR64_9PEZI|nr:mitochondrial carrier domain-containing protein [Hypoxylon rubiginosum]
MPSSPSRLPYSTGSTAADKFLPALQHAVSGSAGTLISTCTLYPLSLVITRLQVQRQLRRERLLRNSSSRRQGTTTTGPNGRGAAAAPPPGEEEKGSDPTNSTEDLPDGIAAAFSQIWSSGGAPRAFYTGLAQDAAKSVLDSFLFFLFYEWFRELRLAARRRRHHSKSYDRSGGLAVLEELAVGVAAGACSRLFTTPIANVVTRKQTASLLNGAGRDKELSAKQILGDIRAEKGLAGLWSGYSASLVLTLNPSITFFLQEFLKKQTVAPERWDSPGAHVTFLLAAVSKAVASAVTYPFQTAKTRLQAGVPVAPPDSPREKGDSAKPEETLIDLASVEAQASEGAAAQMEGVPKEGEGEAKTSAEGEAPAAEASSAEKAPEQPAPPQPPAVPRENVAPPERNVEREVDAKLDAMKAVKDFGRQSIFGTVAQIARTEGVGSLYDGIQGELLKAFLSHGTTMVAKDVVHKLLFKLYLFVGSVLAEVRARRARRARRAAAARAPPAPVARDNVTVREDVLVKEHVPVKENVPVREIVPRPSAPRSEPRSEPKTLPLTEENLEEAQAQIQGLPPRGAPIPPRLLPEPPVPTAYPTAVTPGPRAPAYLPPPPPPPPPVPHQQLRSLRYRIDDVDRYSNGNGFSNDNINDHRDGYPPPYPPTPYPNPSYSYRPPPPPAPATDVSVRTRMSRNDIERATPSVLEDFAVNVVANMIDGTQRGFKDD